MTNRRCSCRRPKTSRTRCRGASGVWTSFPALSSASTWSAFDGCTAELEHRRRSVLVSTDLRMSSLTLLRTERENSSPTSSDRARCDCVTNSCVASDSFSASRCYRLRFVTDVHAPDQPLLLGALEATADRASQGLQEESALLPHTDDPVAVCTRVLPPRSRVPDGVLCQRTRSGTATVARPGLCIGKELARRPPSSTQQIEEPSHIARPQTNRAAQGPHVH